MKNSNQHQMEKLFFVLDIYEGWPPVGTEGVWCEKVGNAYKLLNAPFFIKGIASQDIFEAKLDVINGQVSEFQVIKNSGRSLVWYSCNEDDVFAELCLKFRELECNVESLNQFSLSSVDIHRGVNLKKIDSLIETYKLKGVSFAFPVWRFKE